MQPIETDSVLREITEKNVFALMQKRDGNRK
jgi:hypothetical protein